MAHTPLILYGTPIAEELSKQLAQEVAQFSRAPHLSIIQIGNNISSGKYIHQKVRTAAKIGVTTKHIHLVENISSEEVATIIKEENANPDVNGIILQSPIPSHLSFGELLSHIDPKKDVDGLHPYNQGALRRNTQYHIPCTPLGIMHLLNSYSVPLEGAHVGIINRSTIVGRPLADLLLNANATVSIFHTYTQNLPAQTRACDILISAVGIPEFLTPEYCTSSSVVIDVGCSHTPGGIYGDLSAEARALVKAYSPSPKGVGPMTVIMLLHNTVRAYQAQQEA